MPDRKPSAERLRERLASHGDALRMLQTEALYHTQVAYTCQLLDVVDEVTDPATAERITDAICERLAGDSASEAGERALDAQRRLEVLSSESTLRVMRASRLALLRYTRNNGGYMSPEARSELRELEESGG